MFLHVLSLPIPIDNRAVLDAGEDNGYRRAPL